MIIDSSHLRWGIASGALAAFAITGFWFQPGPLGGWDAGSPLGLAFGGLAAAIFVFAMLLGLRRNRPAWRLGRAATWARAHVWLGTLAGVFALLHAGFRARGTVSLGLMAVLGVVTLSGFVGLFLQWLVPRWMTERVPRETIHAQIPNVVQELKREAEELVAAAEDEALTRFYREELADFLEPKVHGHSLLRDERATRLFAQAEKRLPAGHHAALADLLDICRERAQLFTQERMQRWLRGWTFVHVPLSWALLVLTAAHAIVTLSY